MATQHKLTKLDKAVITQILQTNDPTARIEDIKDLINLHFTVYNTTYQVIMFFHNEQNPLPTNALHVIFKADYQIIHTFDILTPLNYTAMQETHNILSVLDNVLLFMTSTNNDPTTYPQPQPEPTFIEDYNILALAWMSTDMRTDLFSVQKVLHACLFPPKYTDSYLFLSLPNFYITREINGGTQIHTYRLRMLR